MTRKIPAIFWLAALLWGGALVGWISSCGCPTAQRVPPDFTVYNGGSDTVSVVVNGHTLELPPYSGVWWEDPDAWGFGWIEGQRWRLVPATEDSTDVEPTPTIGWGEDWRPDSSRVLSR